jgi:hypothetical protein
MLMLALCSGWAEPCPSVYRKAVASWAKAPAMHKELLKLDSNKDSYIERNKAKHNAAPYTHFVLGAKNVKPNKSGFLVQ